MNLKRWAVLAIIFYVSRGIAAYAASAADTTDTFDPLTSGIKMLWGMLIVLALILIVYLLAKRFLPPLKAGNKGQIKIIESKAVLPRASLILVEVRGREFLVGASATAITSIVEIQDKPSFSSVLAEKEDELLP